MSSSAKSGVATLSPAIAQRRRLSACIIGRDNERTLAACLAGLTDWVDQIVFVDTGSTDRTPDIALEYGAEVHFFPWIDDFAAARNESLRHARGEWIFWLDTDDTLAPAQGRRLRELVDGPHADDVLGYVLQVRCPRPARDGQVETTVVDHVKLFRNRPELRFEGRIHEQILPAIRRAGGQVEFTTIQVEHSGADHSPDGRRRKLERDLRILHLDLAERPDHAFVLFNLGMTYADAGEHARACEYLRKCLQVAGPHETQIRKAYALLVISLMTLGAWDEAVEACARGRELFPDDPELLFREALLHQERGRPDLAADRYRRTLRASGERHFSSLDVGIQGATSRHNLAFAEAARGRPDLAEAQWRRILRDVPTHRGAWRALGSQLLAEGRAASLAVLIRRAAAIPAMAVEGLVLRGRLAWYQGDLLEARRCFKEAACREPQFGEVWRALGHFLFEHGDPEAALAALRQLTKLEPSDGSAWRNLGTMLQRQNRADEAVDALRRSLEVRPGDTATQRQLDELSIRGAVAARSVVTDPVVDAGAPIVPPGVVEHFLPPCSARREFDGARQCYACADPRVSAPGGMVPVEFCRVCELPHQPPPSRCRDTPPPERPALAACVHLGEQLGERECAGCRGKVRVKVFECRHPAHGETTWRECQSCADRRPVERRSGRI